MAVLVALFVIVPIVELYVLVQVTHAIGLGNALGLLILVSLVGAWVVKRQGIATLRRAQMQLNNQQVPTKEMVDGLLILVAGAFLLVPGFVTDAVGLLLLLPPVRAGARYLLVRRWAGEVQVVRATHRGPIDTSATEAGRPELDRLVADRADVPVRDAATVMLVRDASAGLEVFMLQRTLAATFVGGFHVFPGGAVDDADRSADVGRVCDGRTDAEASGALGVEGGGLAYWVAAVRECFEEAGVLLAVDGAGATVSFDDPDRAARFAADREHVHDGTLRLVDLCEREGLRLSLDAIHYISHWITPVGETRRFDTRFFVARAPEGQEPLHDDGETIASLWTRPAIALDRFRAEELLLLPPTIASLEFLAQHDRADEAMTAAAEIRNPPVIQPRLKRDGRDFEVALPGEPGFDELV